MKKLKPYIKLWENDPGIWEHSRNVKNTRVRLVFYTFSSYSDHEMFMLFYHSVILELSFF